MASVKIVELEFSAMMAKYETDVEACAIIDRLRGLYDSLQPLKAKNKVETVESFARKIEGINAKLEQVRAEIERRHEKETPFCVTFLKAFFTDEYMRTLTDKDELEWAMETFMAVYRGYAWMIDGPTEKQIEEQMKKQNESEFKETIKEFAQQQKPKPQAQKTKEANKKHRAELKRREEYEKAVLAAEQERLRQEKARKHKKSCK
jgi:hypothetical protein